MKYLIIFFVCCITTSAGAQSTFQYSYGFGKPLLLEQQSDSGYVVMCWDSLWPIGINMIRLDKFGDTLFTKYIIRPGYRVMAVTACDSGYMAVGKQGSGFLEHSAAFNLNDQGTVVWGKAFAAADSFFTGLHAVCKTTDGNYVAAGYYAAFAGNTWGNMVLIKFNEQGDTLWTRVTGNDLSFIDRIIPTPDGGFLICGQRSPGNLLAKFNDQGFLQWDRVYAVSGEPAVLLDAVVTSDHGYLCTGISGNTSSIPASAEIFKVDSSGIFIWGKHISSLFGIYGYSLALKPDGGFYLFGMKKHASSLDSTDLYLASMNASGDIIWERLYGGPGKEVSYQVIATADGGALLGGTQNSFVNTSGGKLYLVKVDSLGNSGCNEFFTQTAINNVMLADSVYGTTTTQVPLSEMALSFTYESGRNYYNLCTWLGQQETSPGNFNIYPNPAGDFLNIQFENVPYENILIELVDVTGKIVCRTLANDETVKIDTRAVNSGMYFLRISSEQRLYSSSKIIVEKD